MDADDDEDPAPSTLPTKVNALPDDEIKNVPNEEDIPESIIRAEKVMAETLKDLAEKKTQNPEPTPPKLEKRPKKAPQEDKTKLLEERLSRSEKEIAALRLGYLKLATTTFFAVYKGTTPLPLYETTRLDDELDMHLQPGEVVKMTRANDKWVRVCLLDHEGKEIWVFAVWGDEGNFAEPTFLNALRSSGTP